LAVSHREAGRATRPGAVAVHHLRQSEEGMGREAFRGQQGLMLL
jgi:hypothetical protein